MTTENPTPSQLLAAFRDHGVDIKTYRNWDTIGRSWTADGGGLRGVVNHHTATASATGSKGAPSLNWCATAYNMPACNVLVGRGPGDTYFLSAGSCWHSGDGGPWPAIGITRAANVGHFRLFGIEIDDAGRKFGTITDYQIENTARINAALTDLCGWPKDMSRIVTHQAWTDGSYGVNPKGPSPFIGRKGDTLHKAWREYPGSKKAENYNPIFWREEAKKYLITPERKTWDGTIPHRSVVKQGMEQDKANAGTWRVACRLYDLGFRDNPPLPRGEQKYPKQAVLKFQKAQGWENPNGNPGPATWHRLFGKDKP